MVTGMPAADAPVPSATPAPLPPLPVGASGSPVAAPAGAAPKLRVEHLSVAYSDGTESLRDISLDIPEHQITVLFGPAGGGKSTYYAPQPGQRPGAARHRGTSTDARTFWPRLDVALPAGIVFAAGAAAVLHPPERDQC
jgi:hypothetical protein